MLNDLENLQKGSESVWRKLVGIFNANPNQENNPTSVSGKKRGNPEKEENPEVGKTPTYLSNDLPWPRRLNLEEPGLGSFEVIVSELGSVTLRPLFGKKQPVFYASLRKNEQGDLNWEKENGEVLPDPDWDSLFQEAFAFLKKIPPVARG